MTVFINCRAWGEHFSESGFHRYQDKKSTSAPVFLFGTRLFVFAHQKLTSEKEKEKEKKEKKKEKTDFKKNFPIAGKFLKS